MPKPRPPAAPNSVLPVSVSVKREKRPNACIFSLTVKSPRSVHWSLLKPPVPDPWKLLSRPLRFPALPSPIPVVYGSRSFEKVKSRLRSRHLQIGARNHVAGKRRINLSIGVAIWRNGGSAVVVNDASSAKLGLILAEVRARNAAWPNAVAESAFPSAGWWERYWSRRSRPSAAALRSCQRRRTCP